MSLAMIKFPTYPNLLRAWIEVILKVIDVLLRYLVGLTKENHQDL